MKAEVDFSSGYVAFSSEVNRLTGIIPVDTGFVEALHLSHVGKWSLYVSDVTFEHNELDMHACVITERGRSGTDSEDDLVADCSLETMAWMLEHGYLSHGDEAVFVGSSRGSVIRLQDVLSGLRVVDGTVDIRRFRQAEAVDVVLLVAEDQNYIVGWWRDPSRLRVAVDRLKDILGVGVTEIHLGLLP